MIAHRFIGSLPIGLMQRGKARLFDHLVSTSEQRRRYCDIEGSGCSHIQHELKLGRLFDRKIGGTSALQNLTHLARGALGLRSSSPNASLPGSRFSPRYGHALRMMA